jgi:hypothetical protein
MSAFAYIPAPWILWVINPPALGDPGMDSEIKVVPGFEDEARREEHRSSDFSTKRSKLRRFFMGFH